jgi:co-chaperonin GroES (HSP10)
VLVQPLIPPDDPDAIVVTDTPHGSAEVVDISEHKCPDCGSWHTVPFGRGAKVVLRPGAPYHEIRDGGELIGWILATDDVLAEVE